MRLAALITGLLLVSGIAQAAEAVLPISARIVDCRTAEKARIACEKEGLCCWVIPVRTASLPPAR